ncbi:S-layer homology domain-containing protein [Aeromicrobium sp.]|uniref:S-layer homology domain-containing protein n=1 Tax=Aeromicrobium sp. TaxID=1871063 RepID=UPI0025BCAEFE|nr:S-layer homology domain-containing protein [Aeromicrobium sp.]MCK5891912.1 S-layer homology domain-containing protein [Aeromicrobium sp.]
MSSTRLRRAVATAFAATLATGGLVMATTPSAAAAASTVASPASAISDATFVWGVSGYAQDGIFGPWTFTDFTGDATYLEGNVGATPNPHPQTEYLVDPVPATSFPTSKAGKAPNAVKFSEGTGTRKADGSTTVTWDGSYTVNAYPPQFGAPDEIYTDPQLTINADGSGSLTFDFTIGAGIDQGGNEFPAESFGRVTLASFGAGDVAVGQDNAIRVTPDYQGVTNGLPGQDTSCTAANGSTGWWGSWPQEFIDAIDETAVVSHFYSTGCGGKQDTKPALPFDVDFDTTTPTVTVSETVVDPTEDTVTVTVTGTNFLPELSQATRAPVCAAGPPAPCGKSGGYYVAFGKFAEVWQPSAGAAGSTRSVDAGNVALTKWANPASNGYVAPNGQNTVLAENGSFSTTLELDKDAIDEIASAGATTQYGVAVYPASGGKTSVGEVLVPVTFASDPDPEPPFTDLLGAPFADEITWLSTQGITTGYANGDGTFAYRGSESVLREQMAAFLYRYTNDGANPAESAPLATFADVPSGHAFSRHIAWLADQGITTGYAGNTFRPSAPVLREQMAAFLYRLADEPEFTPPAASPFSDVPTSHPFYREITWLASTEITTGYPDGTFQGSAPVLREQMAAFLFRFDRLPS